MKFGVLEPITHLPFIKYKRRLPPFQESGAWGALHKPTEAGVTGKGLKIQGGLAEAASQHHAGYTVTLSLGLRDSERSTGPGVMRPWAGLPPTSQATLGLCSLPEGQLSRWNTHPCSSRLPFPTAQLRGHRLQALAFSGSLAKGG